MLSSSEISIQTINHLGLVAGIIDEIGIEEMINEVVGLDQRELVTSGQVVKGIILNGLGFTSQPLYLFPITNFSHLDSSSFSVHGKYLTNNLIPSKQEEDSPSEPAPITITKGYSRDHRPDLKQFIIDLIVSGDGGIPLFLRVADGNEQDKVNDKTRRAGRFILATNELKESSLSSEETQQVINLTEERQKILKFFSLSVQNYYILSG